MPQADHGRIEPLVFKNVSLFFAGPAGSICVCGHRNTGSLARPSCGSQGLLQEGGDALAIRCYLDDPWLDICAVDAAFDLQNKKIGKFLHRPYCMDREGESQ